MRRFNFYLSLMLLLVFTAACNDEFDQPPMVIPTAQHTANITIAEFKAKHWQDATNYIDTIKEDEVIHGWVTSSDESGNIYKCLYIMDESGAGLAISINQNSLFNNYRLGQEIVLPMKGYFIGKYNGMQQLGYPEPYKDAWEATFLPQAMWEDLVEINGLPDVSKIDTLDISIDELKNDAESKLKYQGRLVRINGVKFSEGGSVFAEVPTPEGKNGSTNRNITDEDGNSLIVRNSGYADFRAEILPEKVVDIVGLLGLYGTTWQLYLRGIDDVILEPAGGTKSNPYTVAQAIDKQNTGAKGWVTGYVVGSVAPERTTVSSNADIIWGNDSLYLDNTIVLADDPECKDYTKCVIVPLPQGSHFCEEANLRDNPNLYKKAIKVKGQFRTCMGIAGVYVETGANNEYVLPVLPPSKGVMQLKETFDSSIPDTWKIVTISGDKPWFWYSNPKDNPTDFFASASGYQGNNPPFETWLLTPALDIKNAKSKILTFDTNMNPYNGTTDKFEVYILNLADPEQATVKVKLNPYLPSNTSGWSEWQSSGDVDLSAWADGCYYIGFRYTAENCPSGYATWRLDNVSFGYGDVIPATRADFETMGSPQGSKYVTLTSTKGWTATNSILLQGGASDAPPVYQFIGYMTGSETKYAMAPTLNGKTSTVGTLTSPTLSGGMTKLSFNYGAAFSDKNLAFRVDVKQNGNVVKTWTVNRTDITTKTAYTFEEACNIQGNFNIEITNLCPSNSTSNKDRLSIWNLVWEQ